MRALSTASFVIAAIVNLLPVAGVLSAERLQRIYGVVLDGPNLVILMRHRAVLFAIVGALLMAGAFHAPLRPIGLAAGLTSMLSFVAVAWLVGSYNDELRRVVMVDLVTSVLLIAGAVAGHLASGR